MKIFILIIIVLGAGAMFVDIIGKILSWFKKEDPQAKNPWRGPKTHGRVPILENKIEGRTYFANTPDHVHTSPIDRMKDITRRDREEAEKRRASSDDSGNFATGVALGIATGNGVLAGLASGSLAGGMIGAAISDSGSSSAPDCGSSHHTSHDSSSCHSSSDSSSSSSDSGSCDSGSSYDSGGGGDSGGGDTGGGW